MPAYLAVFLAFKRATGVPASQKLELFVGATVIVALAGSAWTPWWLALGVAPLAVPAVRRALAESTTSLRAALLAKAVA
jgi:hypothetical protein